MGRGIRSADTQRHAFELGRIRNLGLNVERRRCSVHLRGDRNERSTARGSAQDTAAAADHDVDTAAEERLHVGGAGRDINELDVESLVFERAAAFGHPDAGGVGRDRRVRDAQWRASAGRRQAEKPEKKHRRGERCWFDHRSRLSHMPIRLFTFSTIALGAAITSFAKASNTSPVAGSISSLRFSASAKRAGSLTALLKASRRILTLSAATPGGTTSGLPNSSEALITLTNRRTGSGVLCLSISSLNVGTSLSLASRLLPV